MAWVFDDIVLPSVTVAEKPSAVLTIDPRRQFGQVCIEGTRVPASVVAGCVAGGDSVDETAEDYGITRDHVLLACWWYAWNVEGRGKQAKAIRAAWAGEDLETSWTYRALRVLGGHDPGPLEDPPSVVSGL